MIQGLYSDTINEADDFLYSVGRIRLLEISLLSRHHLERAGETKRVEQAWEIFRDLSRWWGAREVVDPGDWEIHLEARLTEALREVAFMTPAAPMAKAFAIRWDFLSLKEKERRASFGEGGDADWADKIAQEGGFVLQKDIPLDYREALTRLSDRLSREPAPQTVDRVLDAEMYRIIFRWLSEQPVPFARQYFSRRVDLLNFGVALRGKLRGSERQEVQSWFVPEGALPESLFLEAFGGALSSFAGPFEGTVLGAFAEEALRQASEGDVGRRLERMMDDHLTEFLHPAKYIAFGPEPIVGYLHGVEVEVKNVRRIFGGLSRGEPEEEIVTDLRRPYV